MKSKPSKQLERRRIDRGPLASSTSDRNNGAFSLKFDGEEIHIIVSDGQGWDHVSVSAQDRCPTWEAMSYVKNLVWRNDETVIQIHPPSRLHKNDQRHTLHLWRHQKSEVALPLMCFV